MPNCKFLICGDVNGNFEALFNRVKAVIHKRGAFDFLLCVGSFFKAKDEQYIKYIQNSKNVPIQVYILGPNSQEERQFYPQDLASVTEINSKIIYLGKCGRYNTVSGLKIAFLSGKEAQEGESDKDWCHSEKDLDVFKNISSNPDTPVVDVLMTSCWPEGLNKLFDENFALREPSKVVSQLVSRLGPWYHFAGLENKFTQALPYSNINTSGEMYSITRFIGFGSVKSDVKWIIAIHTAVARKMSPIEKNCKYLPSPFQGEPSPQAAGYSRYDLSYGEKKRKGEEESAKKRKKGFSQEDCWFCLTGKKSENHLLIGIKNYAYIALNRGGLVDEHLNIISVEHIASLSVASREVLEEVLEYKKSIRTYFSTFGLTVVFYERNYKTFHMQIHCVPVQTSISSEIKSVFEAKFKQLQLTFLCLGKSTDILHKVSPQQKYFLIEFPSGEELVALIEDRFPLNFAREVLSEKLLLNEPERADWQKCVLSVDEEKKIVNKLKNHFK